MPFPYVFTFYSYKGGVGRSMALINAAYTLARWGRHVLIVDLDLEAPGFSGFLDRTRETAPRSEGAKDVLTLLSEASSALSHPLDLHSLAAQLPPVSNYITHIPPARIDPASHFPAALGSLHVLGADTGRNYQQRLAELNLKALPQSQLIRLSSLLNHYFKAQRFSFRPLGLEDFEPSIETAYDYVLIDSRTGITETGGLCVGPLADRLVVLTGLNDQNVEGTRDFLNEAGIRPRQSPLEPWDDGDPVNSAAPAPVLGPKPTILVASPVPNGEIDFKRRRLGELENTLGLHPLSLSYHPQMALLETVFVRDFPEEYLAAQYRALTEAILALTGDDPATLQSILFPRDRSAGDPAKAATAALRLAPISTDPIFALESSTALWKQLAPLVRRRLRAHIHSQAVHPAISSYNWGVELSQQAAEHQDELHQLFLASACTRYAEALRIKPDMHEALFAWGSALSEQAKGKSGDEADNLFADSYAKYAEALRIKPDMHEALNNWGSALSAQAKGKSGDEANSLFAEACVKYTEALRIKPDMPEALHGWGSALSAQAKGKSGDEANSLFADACAKYAEALRIKPDDHQTLNNWASSLLLQVARANDQSQRQSLLESAQQKLTAAEDLQPGSASFNLACAAALTGDTSSALRWLNNHRQHAHPLSQATIASDSDFDPIRHDPEFARFVASLPAR